MPPPRRVLTTMLRDQTSPPLLADTTVAPDRPVPDGARTGRRSVRRMPAIWQRYVTDVRASADATASTTLATDRQMVAVLITTAISLTLASFLSRDASWLLTLLRTIGLDGTAARIQDALGSSLHADFWQLVFWAGVHVAAYVVPAVLVIRLVLHKRVRDFGLRTRGILPHAGTYALLFAIAFPVIVLASFGSSFQARYPFLSVPPGSLWPYLYAWWLCYFAQFIALEFFFRGFMVHGLAPRLGWASIFVMVVPYNMIHYGKPMPEALAAIVGGIVLGSLSLKTRSIWWGAALHIAIAITMDLCALWHLGRVF